MISFADMMKKQIVMPAHLMDDGVHSTEGGRNLFKDFSSVAQTTATYTGQVTLLLKTRCLRIYCAVMPVHDRWPSLMPAHIMCLEDSTLNCRMLCRIT